MFLLICSTIFTDVGFLSFFPSHLLVSFGFVLTYRGMGFRFCNHVGRGKGLSCLLGRLYIDYVRYVLYSTPLTIKQLCLHLVTRVMYCIPWYP